MSSFDLDVWGCYFCLAVQVFLSLSFSFTSWADKLHNLLNLFMLLNAQYFVISVLFYNFMLNVYLNISQCIFELSKGLFLAFGFVFLLEIFMKMYLLNSFHAVYVIGSVSFKLSFLSYLSPNFVNSLQNSLQSLLSVWLKNRIWSNNIK